MKIRDNGYIKCLNCFYWAGSMVASKKFIGFCKRYPDTEEKHTDHWCGEWLCRECMVGINYVHLNAEQCRYVLEKKKRLNARRVYKL